MLNPFSSEKIIQNLLERGIYSRGLIQHIWYTYRNIIVSFSLDPWDCSYKGSTYANVAYNIDWINDKLLEHKSTNNRIRSSGSVKFKSHVFTLSLIISRI